MQANEQMTEECEEKLSRSVCRGRSSADSASSLPATALQRSSQEDFGADAAKATVKAMGSLFFTEDSSYEENEQQQTEQHPISDATQHDGSNTAATAESRSPVGPAGVVALAASGKPPKHKVADSLQPKEILEELLGDLYIDYSRLEMGKQGHLVGYMVASTHTPFVAYNQGSRPT